jgi:hypothetical protein
MDIPFDPFEQFPVGTRVRLRDGVDPGFYNGFSRVGNEGWVRKRKLDRFQYPQIYVEWDRLNDWSYNGAEDGWTWQGHFEAVEENQMAEAAQPNNQEDLQATVRGITENFVQTLFGALGAPAAQVEPPSGDIAEQPQVEESEGADNWDDLATQASEAIATAPAYLVIALETAEAPGAPAITIPRMFHAARDPEHALIVQSQFAHVLASLQDATIARVLELEVDEDDS